MVLRSRREYFEAIRYRVRLLLIYVRASFLCVCGNEKSPDDVGPRGLDCCLLPTSHFAIHQHDMRLYS